ncbi:MAG TPA: allophanate hydrolase [Burkholderiales bacterium]|nr:allophanate hydrolase [Burkholderiales bacterium]
MPVSYSLTFPEIRQRLRDGKASATAIARDALAAASAGDRHHAWIFRIPEREVLRRAEALDDDPAARALPLFGIPFAVKDNIDVAGYPTTAGCPDFSYLAERTATAVRRLLDAGAILIGKTNLDQFATGLVGTRSPYGICTNALDPRYISGGSSSGSAVAVALNLASFALGTDTAGSGRVPAGFNNIIGFKPTRGAVSAAGVVPACRTLDCVSVFALTTADAWDVFRVIRGYDPDDSYSRHPQPPAAPPARALRIGVPRAADLEFFGDRRAEALFRHGVALIAASGAQIVEFDFAPLRETGSMLYGGPWVAERYVAIRQFFAAHGSRMHPVTREIIARAEDFSAADAFEAEYRLQALRQRAAAAIEGLDALAVPTAPTIYAVAEVEADPIRLNSNLGIYTNFVNFLDFAAIAVPCGMRDDGLPAGLTLIAPAFGEPLLCGIADRLHRASGVTLGASGFALPPAQHEWPDVPARAHAIVAVVGAHLSGMPLNHQLTDLGARLLGSARTAPSYRLYLLPGTVPPKPGLVRAADGAGHSIELELWQMPIDQYGAFVAQVPPPLAIGTLALDDGRSVQGFLCEAHAVAGTREISQFGGWRRFVASST